MTQTPVTAQPTEAEAGLRAQLQKGDLVVIGQDRTGRAGAVRIAAR